MARYSVGLEGRDVAEDALHLLQVLIVWLRSLDREAGSTGPLVGEYMPEFGLSLPAGLYLLAELLDLMGELLQILMFGAAGRA